MISRFTVGQRVQLHPATDAWMQGDRFGEITMLGRKLIHVKMDRSGKIRKLLPKYVLYTGEVASR